MFLGVALPCFPRACSKFDAMIRRFCLVIHDLCCSREGGMFNNIVNLGLSRDCGSIRHEEKRRELQDAMTIVQLLNILQPCNNRHISPILGSMMKPSFLQNTEKCHVFVSEVSLTQFHSWQSWNATRGELHLFFSKHQWRFASAALLPAVFSSFPSLSRVAQEVPAHVNSGA